MTRRTSIRTVRRGRRTLARGGGARHGRLAETAASAAHMLSDGLQEVAQRSPTTYCGRFVVCRRRYGNGGERIEELDGGGWLFVVPQLQLYLSPPPVKGQREGCRQFVGRRRVRAGSM